MAENLMAQEQMAQLTGQIEKAAGAALERIAKLASLPELNQVKVEMLGKKGILTQMGRAMGELPGEVRPLVGKMVNKARQEIMKALEEKEQALEMQALEERWQKEAIDVTLPARRRPAGSIHPLHLVLADIKKVFIGLGFEVVEGPEVELDYYNFEALNVPKHHPARDMQDTFYITDELLLRTQTSPVQIRTMEARRPPVRIIAPGKVYRSDADATHSPMFHQVEGLYVDKKVTLGDLKGILTLFARSMFGEKRGVRFRPSYFPFTEPSAEMDISCFICEGSGCRLCKNEGWIEILGAGMVHPRVFEMVGYDPEAVSGFAFGMGIERVTMLRYGIDDIRLLFDSDIRFLRQF